jgi:hypothetical protein
MINVKSNNSGFIEERIYELPFDAEAHIDSICKMSVEEVMYLFLILLID